MIASNNTNNDGAGLDKKGSDLNIGDKSKIMMKKDTKGVSQQAIH